MNLFRKQGGDTIVEVLIAMTVVAAVLGASYTIVNRTLANARQAQEHSEALQIANKQIEYLTTLMASGSVGDLTDGTPTFNCANKNTGALEPQNGLGDPSQLSRYAAACISDGSVQYFTAFKYDTNPADATNGPVKFFRVYVTWPSVTGHGNDQVTLAYRAYQP